MSSPAFNVTNFNTQSTVRSVDEFVDAAGRIGRHGQFLQIRPSCTREISTLSFKQEMFGWSYSLVLPNDERHSGSFAILNQLFRHVFEVVFPTALK